MDNRENIAPVEVSFLVDSSGRWAGERLAAAIREGVPLSSSLLRTADTLRKDDWVHLDEALVEEGLLRLKGVADLMAAGLTIPLPNAMGTTIFQYEKVTDMDPAIISMAGVVRSENDRPDFALNQLPVPLIHKDFDINLRMLEASKKRHEPLDTTQARTCGRLVSERLESLLFNGYPAAFGGAWIYGLTTHPHRNQLAYGAGGLWDAVGKTGEEILADVLAAKRALEADRAYGPYNLYVSANYSVTIDADFKAASDKTIRQRILEVDGIQNVRVVDMLADDTVVLVQMTRDVVALVDGESVRTVQWDILGGFLVKFKVFCIQVPLVRSDAQGRSGVAHLHA